MRSTAPAALTTVCLFVIVPLTVTMPSEPQGASVRARSVHDRAIVVDSHDDTTQRLLFDETFDIGRRSPNGNLDIPRMRQGASTPCSSRSGSRAR
jgi:hypothetical protein